MVFSSIEFILYFLPVFFLIYGITPTKYKNITLLLGSLFFYAWGESKYCLLLLASVVVNYLFGLYLGWEHQSGYDKNRRIDKRKKCLLGLAILFNVALLFAFKFGVDEVDLPLGISFYTFQMLSYLIDVYRGEVRRARAILNFANYVTMFPQLTMGPIVKYGEVRNSFKDRAFSATGIQDGLGTFIVGLAMKVLLADRIGLLWHEVQVTGFESISTPLAWMAAVAYSMKLYFDFYGYSLMAIGLGRMLGFQLPENFHTPYMAHSVRDFYRRWHMTLGRWFCQYVYIPMGGNRKGELRTIANLLVVWLLTALWHGMTVNFLLWGGLLVFCIIIERQIEKLGIGKRCKVLPHLYVWFVILISWMCFANTDLSQLQVYLGRMFGMEFGVPIFTGGFRRALWDYKYLFIVGGLCCTGLVEKAYDKWKNHILVKLVLAVLLWLCIGRLMEEGNNPFMYLQF